jgi:hypothetical protein
MDIEEYKTTNKRSVYNKMRKRYLADKGLICCDRCRYHRGENATRRQDRKRRKKNK